jgi:hypothetical protein
MIRAAAIATIGMFSASCGGGSSTPSAPSAARPGLAASAVTLAVASASPTVFSASSADLARCLSGAADAACFSGARLVVRGVTAGATAPGAPGNLAAFLNGKSAHGSAIQLAWTAPTSGDPVVGYVIEAGSASGLADLAAVATGNTLTSFGAPDVVAGTYFVRIRAQNGAGIGPPSNEVILVTGNPLVCTTAPGAPTGLTSTVSGGTVSLRWTSPGGSCTATSYILQAGLTSGSSALANSNVGSVTSYTATGVGAGTYYVRVVAANAFGQSAASNEVIVTVGSTTTGGSLTGTWIGLSPDGFVWDASTGNCDLEHDMQLTLTQTGAALSGSLYDSVRKAARSACTSQVGVITGPWTVTGTAGAGTLTLSATIMGQTLVFSGTFTNTRMALSGAGGLATLTLNRQ